MAYSFTSSSSNVYEHVIIGRYEDRISGELANVRKKAEAQIGAMAKSTNQAALAFDGLKLAARAMVGVLALTGLRGVWSDLVAYARTTNGEAKILVDRYDAAGEHIKKIVVDSKAFTDLMTYSARGAEWLASGLGTALGWMDKLNLKASDFLGPFFGTIAKFSDLFQQGDTKSSSFWNRQIDKVNQVTEAWSKGVQIFQDYADEMKKAEESFIGYGGATQGDSTLAALEQRAEAYRALMSTISALQSNVPTVAAPVFPKPADDSIEGLATYNDRLRDTLFLMHRLAYEEGGRMSDLLGAMAQDIPTKFEQARYTIEGFVNAGVAGFQALGAALVQNKNVLKAFLGMFLQTIAQMAVQLGTWMILTGLAQLANPLLGGNGAASIAAGTALVVFGGALGAIAQGLQSRGGGRSVSGGGAARDFGSSDTADRGRSSVYNVTINVSTLDQRQIDPAVIRDLTRILMREIDKETNLGTTPSYVGG